MGDRSTLWRLEEHQPSVAVAAVVLSAFTALASACAGRVDLGPRVSDGTPVVLISVDTLRSDRLPAYGYDGVETPAIDRLRSDAILFERAYTHVPLTLPAHTSLLSGLLPSTHRVRDNLGYTVDTADAPLLQQVLKGAGYATGAAVSAYSLRGATGIAAGFDLYDDRLDLPTEAGDPTARSVERPGPATLEVVRPWLRSVADEPFFLFFHIFEPHTPYEPPAEFASRYPDPYDGEVAAADAVVGGLLDELRDLGVYDAAMILFLSDHGEDLGDHGEGEHGVFLYRSTLQVPLMLKLPGSARAGETVPDPVQLIDVAPTVLVALGLEGREGLPGTPLLAPTRPDPAANPIYVETFFPRIHFGWSELAGLIADRHHYIDAPQPELFDIVQDPDELDNLLEVEPDVGARLEAALAPYDRSFDAPEEVDAETRRSLEALGYVGRAAAAAGDAELPDPKSRVHTLDDIMRAYTLFHDGDLEAAVPALRTVLANNPRIQDAWGYLALALLELGRQEEAADAVLASLEYLPESREALLSAAGILEGLGRLDEAERYAEAAIPHDPAAAHELLASIAMAKGRLGVAERHAREAIDLGSRHPAVQLILADALIARGQARQALTVLTRAVGEGAGGDRVKAKLAIARAMAGDFAGARSAVDGFHGEVPVDLLLQLARLAVAAQVWPEAQSWCDRARELDPDHPAILLVSGMVALNEGRLVEARKLLLDAIVADRDSFEAWLSLGMVFARQEEAWRAVIAWERAHELDPDHLDVLYYLGLAHAQMGQRSQAIDCLEEYTIRAPLGPARMKAEELLQQLRASYLEDPDGIG